VVDVEREACNALLVGRAEICAAWEMQSGVSVAGDALTQCEGLDRRMESSDTQRTRVAPLQGFRISEMVLR
jgi:hypothetical protein